MNKINIRSIKNLDLKPIMYIYNFHIENSFGIFEEHKFSIKQFSKLVDSILIYKLPFIVIEVNDKIAGFAFLKEYRNKSGYRFTYENSIYVHPSFMNKGIGSKLLKHLIKVSKKNKKIKNIIAVIGDSKNYSSIKIHSKNGFKKIGILKKIAIKKNKWLDSVYMQKTL